MGGIEQVLFVLCLVMQAVHWRDASGWRPRAGFGTATMEAVRVVTAFTLAHSLTLALASLDVIRSVRRSSSWSLRLQNLAVFRANLALLAFGFASVLQALSTGASSQLVALLGFNLGVEIGQLAIVGLWLPLAYWPPLYESSAGPLAAMHGCSASSFDADSRSPGDL